MLPPKERSLTLTASCEMITELKSSPLATFSPSGAQEELKIVVTTLSNMVLGVPPRFKSPTAFMSKVPH